jgi:hypothetical protein
VKTLTPRSRLFAIPLHCSSCSSCFVRYKCEIKRGKGGFGSLLRSQKGGPAPCKVVTSSGSQTKRCDVVTLSSKWDIETFLRKSCNMRRKAQSCSLNMSVFYRLATKYWHSGINLFYKLVCGNTNNTNWFTFLLCQFKDLASLQISKDRNDETWWKMIKNDELMLN